MFPELPGPPWRVPDAPEQPQINPKHGFLWENDITIFHGPPCQTLVPLQLFPQPMDRAEVLHAPSYDISGKRKNTLGENELVLSCEISTFPSDFAT